MSGEGLPRTPTRIIDVARRAGVSAQTVSNVVHGRNGYSEQTRQRVLAAIEKLQFRPNRSAQSLRYQRTMQLGFDLSGSQLDLRNPFAISFLRVLIPAAARAGYRIVVFTHQDDSLLGFEDLIATRGVDGFVLSDSAPDDPRARALAGAGVPFVAFGRKEPDLPQTWVDIDNVAAIAAMVDYLVEKGHRDFGYVGYPGEACWTRERRDGVRQRLRHHGCRLPSAAVLAGTPTTIAGDLRDLLTRKRRPSALIAGSDSLAVIALNVACSMGLVAGRDIAITGFDGDGLRSIVEPSLTTVRIPLETVAEALIARFVREVRDGPTGEAGALVDTELWIGASA